MDRRSCFTGNPRSKVGSQVVLSDLRGEVTTLLCSGSHPSWSPDGAKFVCARTVGEGTAESRYGSWPPMERKDGQSGREPRSCWSPDGNGLRSCRDNGIVLYDTASQKSSELVAREDHRYTGLGDALAREPNSRRLALLATRPTLQSWFLFPFQKIHGTCFEAILRRRRRGWQERQRRGFQKRQTGKDRSPAGVCLLSERGSTLLGQGRRLLRDSTQCHRWCCKAGRPAIMGSGSQWRCEGRAVTSP